jgi:hypothetical protein
MQVFARIAKAAILQDLCPKGMGVKRINSLCKFVPEASNLQALRKIRLLL